MNRRGCVTWGKIVSICECRGICILQGKGDERKLKGTAPDGKSRVQTIGHRWCRSKKADVPRAIVAAFKRNFGIKDDELYDR